MELYKYLAAARIDVLQRKLIRFTPPTALNDPFEFRPFFEKAIDMVDMRQLLAEEPLDLNPGIERAYDELDEDTKSLLSLEDYKRLVGAVVDSDVGRKIIDQAIEFTVAYVNMLTPHIEKGIHEAAGNRIGILSLSEIADNQLMWAHYAQSHQGFALRFDGNHQFFNRPRTEYDEMYRIRKVIYRDLDRLPAMYGTTGEDLFLSKGLDWSYEKEWRMLVPLEDADEVVEGEKEPIYLFRIPPSCITGVILGARVATELEQRIRELVSTEDLRHLKIGRIEYRERAPGLRILWPDS